MMKRNTLHAAAAGALLLGSAGIASAAQQLVCDQQPTNTTAASCTFRDMPERISSQPADSTYYVVEPAASERVIVREPARERVVVQEPVATVPVDTVVMRYPVDDAFPDPNPRQEAQARVYIPREPVTVTERGFFGEVTPD
jgi:hypothetical protein